MINIQDQTELNKTCAISTSIITPWNKEAGGSIFKRASFQVGLVGAESGDYKGVAGNAPIEIEKLSEGSKQAMEAIDAALHIIWDEVKAGYPDYAPPVEPVEEA